MSLTRDWSTSGARILDHTKFKDAPGEMRSIMVDLEERLADVLYGFTSGETNVGMKRGRLITIGTAVSSTPPGTGDAVSVDVYARANGTDATVELYAIDASGNEVQLTDGGKIPLDVSGRLANDCYLIGRNFAGDGNVNILKVNTADALELASHPVAPDTNPSAALAYAPKGYVDKTLPSFGVWVDKSASYGAQQATTDGFVCAYAACATNAGTLVGYTDANADPSTIRMQVNDTVTGACCIMFPVKKNDYWKVTVSTWTIGAVYFIPLGS